MTHQGFPLQTIADHLFGESLALSVTDSFQATQTPLEVARNAAAARTATVEHDVTLGALFVIVMLCFS